MQDVWIAVGAIAAIIAAIIAVPLLWWTARQLSFGCWLRAQEIFMDQDFVAAREEILKHFGYECSIPSRIGKEDEKSAKLVCRRMDELARLQPYLGRRVILKTWGYPLGKSWMILETTVEEQRHGHPQKWDAFERLGEAAVKKLDLRYLNQQMAKRKKQDNKQQSSRAATNLSETQDGT